MAVTPLETLILKHEGLRLLPYDDATGKAVTPATPLQGKLTIGVGRNLTDVGISHAEAMRLLKTDLQQAENKAHQYKFFQGLSKSRQAVVVSMVFNIGSIGSFVKFRAALSVKDYALAAEEMLDSAWHRQVGKRAEDLARIMVTGELPT
jgi:lysozyme